MFMYNEPKRFLLLVPYIDQTDTAKDLTLPDLFQQLQLIMLSLLYPKISRILIQISDCISLSNILNQDLPNTAILLDTHASLQPQNLISKER